MVEKRLCTIDSCEYCPYLEKKTHTVLLDKINLNTKCSYYKCNKTLLCVESGKIGSKNPLGLLFKYCPLPDVENDDLYCPLPDVENDDFECEVKY